MKYGIEIVVWSLSGGSNRLIEIVFIDIYLHWVQNLIIVLNFCRIDLKRGHYERS
jgi:hypothetical protein